MEVKRGEVYLADFTNTTGTEASGKRPVLIVQNNVANRFIPTVTVVAIGTKAKDNLAPTHVFVPAEAGFHADSVIYVEQIRSIDKSRLEGKFTELNNEIMNKVDKAILIHFGLNKSE